MIDLGNVVISEYTVLFFLDLDPAVQRVCIIMCSTLSCHFLESHNSLPSWPPLLLHPYHLSSVCKRRDVPLYTSVLGLCVVCPLLLGLDNGPHAVPVHVTYYGLIKTTVVNNSEPMKL